MQGRKYRSSLANAMQIHHTLFFANLASVYTSFNNTEIMLPPQLSLIQPKYIIILRKKEYKVFHAALSGVPSPSF